jgi:hypothetical protein
MKLQYYIPFAVTYSIVKILGRFLIPTNPMSRWHKYFSAGFNKESYSDFMDEVKENDSLTYWMTLISNNCLFFGVLSLLIALSIR